MSPAMELLRNNVISDTAQIDAAIAELAETWNRHDHEGEAPSSSISLKHGTAMMAWHMALSLQTMLTL